MDHHHLRLIDVDLLLAFEATLTHLNVTRAAKELGIRQSTLSARLGKLRNIFGDRLFVPSPDGRGVLATPRALGLQVAVIQVLQTLEAMVRPGVEFSPTSTQRTFTIALHELPAVMLAPGLVPLLAANAPLSKLALVTPPLRQLLSEQLESGAVDVYVGDSALAHDGWLKRTLFKDRFLTAQRKGHPRGCKALDLEAFCVAEHLLVSADGSGFFGHIDAALAETGRTRRVALSIQNYAVAPIIIASSDYLCTLPSRFLRQFEDSLDLFDPPLALASAEIDAYWHPRFQDDLPHRWLREQLFAAADATRHR